MAEGETACVSIDLHVGAEPIEGALRVGGGEPQPFRGWLQLTPLLEAAARIEEGDASWTDRV
jgi:hypothetical protein